MIILTSTADSVQIILERIITTNQMQCYASFRDTTSSAITPGSRVVATNSTTAVDIVQAPASSTQRIVDFLSVQNVDTVQNDVTIRFNDSGTTYILFKVRLGVGDKIEYHEGKGFRVINSSGAQATYKSFSSSVSNIANGTVYLPLDLNLTSSLGVFPTPITGLEFPIILGKNYEFKFFILYDVDATTTGAKFNLSTESINGDYSALFITGITASTVFGGFSSPDFPFSATSATTPATTQNCTKIEGNLKASSNGVVKVLAAHDSGGTLTIKKGSLIHFRQLN